MSVFQTLIKKHEAGFILKQPLDAVLTPYAEKEQGRLVRIQLEARLHNSGQPVY